MSTGAQNAYSSQFEKVKAITDQLEAGIQALFESDKFKQYLQTLSKFHDYSLNNTILIAMQKPDATLVAGYTAWKKLFGRQVQKGESGIRILAPTPYKKKMEVEKTDPVTGDILTNPDGTAMKETKEVLVPAFKVVHVFDVSQTEGKPLPTIGINELTGDVAQYELFFEALKQSCPVPIEFEQIEGGAKGYFHTVENRIAIQEGMSQVQTIKTAIHEMTHQKLHSIDPNAKVDPLEPKLTRNHKEVEAESVAFTVCQHYGIDTGDYSFAYVAGWSHGKETPELKASLDKIRRTASEMITEIDGHLAVLQKAYTWSHLTANDVKNIECIESEYISHLRMTEHTFSCEIAGEGLTLKLVVSQHDNSEGFTIHTEGKDIWGVMPESELRKLETILTSTAELAYWTAQIEKAETVADVKEVSFGFMEAENLGLSQEQCQKFWAAVEQREAALSPPSALAGLHTKKEKSEKAKASKPKGKTTGRKIKKSKKEESR